MPVLTDEVRYRVLRLIEESPAITQRDVARELGISLGKANFCLRALIEKGLLKAESFRNNRNKRAYMYVMTPSGIAEKAKVTARFIRRKLDEYAALQAEIAELMEQARGLRDRDLQEAPASDKSHVAEPLRRVR